MLPSSTRRTLRRGQGCEVRWMIQCARCGAQNNPADKFCMTCGNRLSNAPGIPPGGQPPTGPSGFGPAPNSPNMAPGYGPPPGGPTGGPPPGFGPPAGFGPPPGGPAGGPPPGFGPPAGFGPPPGGPAGGPPPGFGPPAGFGPPPGGPAGGPPPGFGPPAGFGPPPGGPAGGPPPGFGPPAGFGPPPGGPAGGPPPGFGPPAGFGPPPGGPAGGPPPGFGPPAGFGPPPDGGSSPNFGPPPGFGSPGPEKVPAGFGPPPGAAGVAGSEPKFSGPEAFASTGFSGAGSAIVAAAGGASPFDTTTPQGAIAPPAGPGGKRELVGFLVSYQSDTYGQFWPLYAGRNLIGRTGAADGLDIEINDPHTSSVHAALHVDSGTRASFIEDLGSTNGTFYNDEAAPLGTQGRRDLRDNDRVKLGGLNLVVKIVPRM